jgi:FkbM family methyltransferase
MEVTNKQYWHHQFIQNGGDNRFLFNFDLNSNSTVFDIGSYDGAYFRDISRRYSCHIHAFEPVPTFYQNSCFMLPGKVKVRNYALGKVDDTFTITLADNASGAFAEGGEKIECKKISFNSYVKENNISQIDLLKVNCEGGEYELLEAIIESNWLQYIDNIIIQFHLIPEIPVETRQKIVDKIGETHNIMFSFPFIWEGWKTKKN